MENARKAPQHPLIIIPARMASTRLPGKPLADLCGEPMIVHVWRRAVESGLGEVVVAADGGEIAGAIEKAGGHAVLTNPDHPSGSDRIWEALEIWESRSQSRLRPAPSGAQSRRDQQQYDAIINLQGDLPTLDPQAIKAAWKLLENPQVDIGTLVAEIKSDGERSAAHVVKAALDREAEEKKGRALSFARLPSGEGPFYHHIGIYAYRREALAQFVKAPPDAAELREKLEQLRALALGLRIEAQLVDTVPLGVDTPEDLEKARKILGAPRR